AGTAVLLDLEIDLLAFDQVRHASTLDCGDVDENVLTAIVGLDEAEALGGVKPLDRSSCHSSIPSYCDVVVDEEKASAVSYRDFGDRRQQTREPRASGSIGRNINGSHIVDL